MIRILLPLLLVVVIIIIVVVVVMIIVLLLLLLLFYSRSVIDARSQSDIIYCLEHQREISTARRKPSH